jgi:hypothetical protein
MLAIMSRLRLLVALIGVSVLAALLALAAFSTEADASHSWGKYHWARTSNPFTLKLGDNVSSEWDSYLIAASGPAEPYPVDPSPTFISTNDWSDSSVLDTTVVAGQARTSGDSPTTCRPTLGRVEVCNAAYETNWLGLAQIWVSGNHIVKGTTKVNDTHYNTAKYNTPAWRHLVMCQEIGHTFGLDHQDETFNNTNRGSCMDYTNDPDGGPGGASSTDRSNEQPNRHDYNQLETIYAHLDGTTTVGTTSTGSTLPPAANQGAFNSRAEWGRLVEESPNGNVELWVRSFGDEAKLITWVIRP